MNAFYKEMHETLIAAEKEAQDAISAGQADLQEPHTRVADETDRALATSSLTLTGDLSKHHASRLRAITAALARIVDGSYGLCEDCGTEIAKARLRAHPTAERCVNCAGIEESRLGRYRHHRAAARM